MEIEGVLTVMPESEVTITRSASPPRSPTAFPTAHRPDNPSPSPPRGGKKSTMARRAHKQRRPVSKKRLSPKLGQMIFTEKSTSNSLQAKVTSHGSSVLLVDTSNYAISVKPVTSFKFEASTTATSGAGIYFGHFGANLSSAAFASMTWEQPSLLKAPLITHDFSMQSKPTFGRQNAVINTNDEHQGSFVARGKLSGKLEFALEVNLKKLMLGAQIPFTIEPYIYGQIAKQYHPQPKILQPQCSAIWHIGSTQAIEFVVSGATGEEKVVIYVKHGSWKGEWLMFIGILEQSALLECSADWHCVFHWQVPNDDRFVGENSGFYVSAILIPDSR
jgi:hypothetical protein